MIYLKSYLLRFKSINQIQLVLIFSAIGWIFSKSLSLKLWHNERLMPLVPTIDFFEIISSLHSLFFYNSFLLISGLVFFGRKKWYLIFVLLFEFFLCLLDDLRWQPWQYQYMLVLLFAIIFFKMPKYFLSALLLLIGCTYFFSGLYKFNGAYLYNIWDELILKKTLSISPQLVKTPVLHYAGLLLALIEVLLGLSLLFLNKFQRYVVALAMLMHCLIIVFLSPLLANINHVVIPWNFVMIGYLFIFKNHPTIDVKSFLFFKRSYIIILLLVLLPALNSFKLWPSYMSFKLYTGDNKVLIVCKSKNTTEIDQFSKYSERYCPHSKMISTYYWSLKELNVPVPPDERVLIKLAKELERKYPYTFINYRMTSYPYKTSAFISVN